MSRIELGQQLPSADDVAAWAHLCGTAPIPASSGKVTRYRLNRGGDRQANRALWGIVITRLRNDPRTKAYMDRRLAEGR